MGLLLLANLDPIDIFWKEFPDFIREYLVNFQVHVDDFIMIFSFDTSNVIKDQIRIRVEGTYIRLAHKIKHAGGNFAIATGKVAATDRKIAQMITWYQNVCQCRMDDKMSDKCRCDNNHNILAQENVIILGVDYAAGNPMNFAKNRESVEGAKQKIFKIALHEDRLRSSRRQDAIPKMIPPIPRQLRSAVEYIRMLYPHPKHLGLRSYVISCHKAHGAESWPFEYSRLLVASALLTFALGLGLV